LALWPGKGRGAGQGAAQRPVMRCGCKALGTDGKRLAFQPPPAAPAKQRALFAWSLSKQKLH
jgi:hypothetical protein